MKKLSKFILSFVLIMTLCVSMTACNFIVSNDYSTEGELIDSYAVAEDIKVAENDSETTYTFSEAYKLVARAVATISIKSSSGTTSGGSGVFIDVDDGVNNENEHYMITCFHVIEDMGEISVYVPDEYGYNVGDAGYDSENYTFTGTIDSNLHSEDAVKLVGGDAQSDVAVLKITTDKDIVECKIPSNYSFSAAEDVFAIGYCGAEAGSFNKGTISYGVLRHELFETGYYLNVIQHDVAINHGSSGGGLFNLKGELIGITNGGSSTYSLVNFALPLYVSAELYGEDTGVITMAKQLIGTCTEYNYGYITGRQELLGITATSTANNGAEVYISAVTSGSQAEKAGLMAKDVITAVKIGDREKLTITGYDQFTAEMKNRKIGDVITFYITRQTTSYMGWKVVVTDEEKEISLTVNQYYFCDTGYRSSSAN